MIKQKIFLFILVFCAMFYLSQSLFSQQTQKLSLPQVYALAISNSKQLKLAHASVEVAKLATSVTQTAWLPRVDASLSALYLGNGVLMDRNFSNSQQISMPHFANNFALEASQVIFSGGAIQGSIEKAKLNEQMAELSYAQNELDICFLVTGFYLDLYKLNNEREVFAQNIKQTEMLIAQVKSKELQGMALHSDITRHELLLQNFNLALIEIDNNRKIINNQLVVALGLPAQTEIEPDSSVLSVDVSGLAQESLQQQAANNLPELKMASLNKDIVTKELNIAKADYYPQLALIAANNFNGPILIEVPTINKNFNFWYVGVGLKYNLASFYTSNRKVQLLNQKQKVAECAEALSVEHAQLAVHNAWVKFKEAFDQLSVYQKSSELANENYRVINNRYLSEVVLITEMLDASNIKLNAELQVINARLNVVYNYYKLQREVGKSMAN